MTVPAHWNKIVSVVLSGQMMHFQTARVGFKELTEDEKLGGVDYSPNKQRIEYRAGSFPGLKEAVDAGSKSELLVIKGLNYLVRKVDYVVDGDCYIAELAAK